MGTLDCLGKKWGFKRNQNISVCAKYCVALIVLFSVTITVNSAQYDRFSKSRPARDVNKAPPPPSEKLTALINWLFGPPADAASGQLRRGDTNVTNEERAAPQQLDLKTPRPADFARKLEAKESPANNHSRSDNKKDIEITDIQASVGTELHSSQLSGNPSQVNLKDELDLVEKFDQSVKRQPPQLRSELPDRTGRLKREQYKPIKVPYTPKKDDVANSILRQRQLLVNPLDQQMLALQQQQAAAAIMQQQQMNALLNSGNRYSLLDDYDREDDSDEDSDELDDFSKYGPPPMIEHHHMYLRDGLPPPVLPYQRKLGWGLRRRSVGDKKKLNSKRTHSRGRNDGEKTKSSKDGKGKKKGTSLKNGHWFLDDYDLNSDFYDKPQERKHLPSYLRDKNDHLERPELDEEEHYQKHHSKPGATEQVVEVPKHRGDMEEIFRDMARQDETTTAASSETTAVQSSETTAAGGETTTASGDTSTGNTEATTASSETTTTGSNETTTIGGTTSAAGNGTTASSGQSTTASSGQSTTPASTNSTTTASSNSTTEAGGNETTTEAGETTTTAPKPKPPYTATLNCRCGTQSVRGENTGNNSVIRVNVNPWLVAVYNGSKQICSGSIINDRFVLTSKTCVKNATSQSRIQVVAGIPSKRPTNYTVDEIIFNPNVNIALLRLRSPITPSHVMRPVCLPIGKRYSGQYSTGQLITFKRIPPNVQMVDTEVGILGNGNKKCEGKGKGVICTGPPGSIKCGGDTGGVLMVYRGGYSYEQIGVVSGTVGCRSTQTPGVYTDLRKRTQWILHNTKEGNYCKSPTVTDEDLTSTTRVGDPEFEFDEDLEVEENYEESDSEEEEDDQAAEETSYEDEE